MSDLAKVARRIAEMLVERRETIAVAESSAGGLISAALLAVPGASRYFLGGAVVYTALARESLLGITAADMKGLRSASEPYARLLARTVRKRFDASWALAETGAAGPDGNRYGDLPGHACFAVCGPDEHALTLETGATDRDANMDRFAATALLLLERELLRVS